MNEKVETRGEMAELRTEPMGRRSIPMGPGARIHMLDQRVQTLETKIDG